MQAKSIYRDQILLKYTVFSSIYFNQNKAREKINHSAKNISICQ